MYADIRRLPLEPARGLVHHDARVRQRAPLASRPSAQKQRGHGRCLADAQRADRVAYILHPPQRLWLASRAACKQAHGSVKRAVQEIVEQGAQRTCIVSYIASPDVTTPPCELMYMLICVRSIHQPMLLQSRDTQSS